MFRFRQALPLSRPIWRMRKLCIDRAENRIFNFCVKFSASYGISDEQSVERILYREFDEQRVNRNADRLHNQADLAEEFFLDTSLAKFEGERFSMRRKAHFARQTHKNQQQHRLNESKCDALFFLENRFVKN